jgi:hypothetical protein
MIATALIHLNFSAPVFSSNQLWILYLSPNCKDTFVINQKYPPRYNSSMQFDASAFQSTICKTYNTSYTVNFTFKNSVQKINAVHGPPLIYIYRLYNFTIFQNHNKTIDSAMQNPSLDQSIFYTVCSWMRSLSICKAAS